jgi:hypothetical protein
LSAKADDSIEKGKARPEQRTESARGRCKNFATGRLRAST